jgi:ribosomal protein S18 acetylase RimI-like enzyme
MELNEEIYRIKSLLTENSDPYKIWVASNIESDRGYCVYYLTENNDIIGVVTITDLNKALNNHEFNNDDKLLHTNYGNLPNTAYAHTIVVEDQFKRSGYGLKLLKECINVARNSGYSKISLTIKKNNIPSQNLVKKVGFKPHYSNGDKDLFVLDLD